MFSDAPRKFLGRTMYCVVMQTVSEILAGDSNGCVWMLYR